MQLVDWHSRMTVHVQPLVSAAGSLQCFWNRLRDDVFVRTGRVVGSVHEIRASDNTGRCGPYLESLHGNKRPIQAAAG